MTIRDKIISTSSDMFLKYGLRSVSIDDICNELRISKKTFYTYFNQKEELIEEILSSLRSGRIKFFKRKIFNNKNDNSIDKLLKGFSYFNEQDEEKFVSFFFDMQKYYPDILQKHVNDMNKGVFDSIKHNICEGIKDNLFRDDIDADAMAIIITTIKGQPISNLKKYHKFSTQQGYNFLIDCYVRMMANDNGLKYYLDRIMSKEKINSK